MKKIVLASKSPRRKELLGRFLDSFTVLCDDSEEIRISGELPQDMVRRLAMEKVKNVATKLDDDALIIGADTVVTLNGKVLGKPANAMEAFRMLSELSGCEHSVFTGIAVLDTDSGIAVGDVEETKVKFRELDEDEINFYIQSGEPMDKAGAYGIQEFGALFVEGICGDYFNVVGLPLCKLDKILREQFSINLLNS